MSHATSTLLTQVCPADGSRGQICSFTFIKLNRNQVFALGIREILFGLGCLGLLVLIVFFFFYLGVIRGSFYGDSSSGEWTDVTEVWLISDSVFQFKRVALRYYEIWEETNRLGQGGFRLITSVWFTARIMLALSTCCFQMVALSFTWALPPPPFLLPLT